MPAPDGAAVVAWVDEHVVRQLEQPPDRVEQLAREWLRPTFGVQVRSANVADEQRVACEDEPGFVRAAAAVADYIRVMGRRVARRGERLHERVTEINRPTVSERRGGELDADAFGKVRRCSGRLHQRRQAGEVIGLEVRLKDGDDRRANPLGRLEVALNQVDMGIDDGKLRCERQPNR
jgi:hypothetical protein